MSRTRHHGWKAKRRKFGELWLRSGGYEFCGKEGGTFMVPGPYTKQRCHRMERIKNQIMIFKIQYEIEDNDVFI